MAGVGGDHLAWVGLRATVASWPDARMLGEFHDVTAAVHRAERDRPTLIVIATNGTVPAPIALVRRLREVSPASRVIVVTTPATLSYETLRQLGELEVRGYLLWDDLVEETLTLSLAIALRTHLAPARARCMLH